MGVREEVEVADDGDDRRRSAVAQHLLGDDLARLADSLRQLGSRFPGSGRERRQVEAATAVAERAGRTLDRIGGDHGPTREPTRLAVLAEQVVGSHDPEQRRVSCEVASIVVNLDPVRVERILDRLVVLALSYAVPGTAVTLAGASVTDGVQLTVTYDGRDAQAGLRAARDEGSVTTDWTVLLHLVDDLQGTIDVEPGGTSVTVRLPRSDRR